MTIGFNGREVALRNPAEAEQAARRLTRQNIREETWTMEGTLTGIVPAGRFFQCRVSDTGELIEGRIGQEIPDPYRVAARYANREVKARIRRIQVGQGQPNTPCWRYWNRWTTASLRKTRQPRSNDTALLHTLLRTLADDQQDLQSNFNHHRHDETGAVITSNPGRDPNGDIEPYSKKKTDST